MPYNTRTKSTNNFSSSGEEQYTVPVCSQRLRPGLQNSPRQTRSPSYRAPHRRNLQTTSFRSQQNEPEWTQAQPHSGYYADILSSPQPTAAAATSETTQSSLPDPTPSSTPTPTSSSSSTTREPTPEERARIVFGSRLAGSGYRPTSSMTPDSTWRTINGVPVPPRPSEPDNCCMSGCVHCVWDDYRDAVEEWALRLRAAKNKSPSAAQGKHVTSGKVPVSKTRGDTMKGIGRSEVEEKSASMDDDGGGSETNWSLHEVGDGGVAKASEDDVTDLFGGIPVGIREFMKTEKKLRDMHRREQEMEGEKQTQSQKGTTTTLSTTSLPTQGEIQTQTQAQA